METKSGILLCVLLLSAANLDEALKCMVGQSQNVNGKQTPGLPALKETECDTYLNTCVGVKYSAEEAGVKLEGVQGLCYVNYRGCNYCSILKSAMASGQLGFKLNIDCEAKCCTGDMCNKDIKNELEQKAMVSSSKGIKCMVGQKQTANGVKTRGLPPYKVTECGAGSDKCLSITYSGRKYGVAIKGTQGLCYSSSISNGVRYCSIIRNLLNSGNLGIKMSINCQEKACSGDLCNRKEI